MTENNNPYAAPEADVTLPQQESVADMALLPEARKVSLGAGIDWIKQAWAIMRKNLGTWILMIIVYIIIQVAFGLVPFLGDLASSLLAPVFTAGLLMAARTSDFGGDIQFSSMFDGFKSRFKSLLALGGLTLAAFFLIAIVFGGAIAISAAMGGGFESSEQMFESLFTPINIILMILGVIATFAIGLMFAYATHLVALNEVPVFQSLKKSFDGAWKNILPLIIYFLIMIVLVIISMIPLGLGLLISIPVIFIASYVSYKQIFLA